jgi:hypothetical protein
MMNLQQLDDLYCAEISNIKAAQKVLSLDGSLVALCHWSPTIKATRYLVKNTQYIPSKYDPK